MSEELTWLPAWRLRDLIRTREVSPVEVLDHFLDRIEEHNDTLHAFAVVDRAEARDRAGWAEKALAAGEEVGPLHGLPTAVKENIAVAGHEWLGSTADRGPAKASRDSLTVSRLRDAGAVLVGINTMMGTTRGGLQGLAHPDGFNWAAEARNPWDTTRTAGWSSSGGASSTAAGLLPFAIGTDGGGSTRLPAAYSGVVGVHTTTNLIPTVDYDHAQYPSLTQSHGPLTRNVVDAAMVLQVLAGPDGRDFTCLAIDPPDYMADIDKGVDGMRLGWTDDFGFTEIYAMEESDRVIAAVRQAAQGFASIGAKVETVDTVWEDFFPGQGATGMFGGAAPDAIRVPSLDEWGLALDLRQRNWLRFREALTTYDVLLSPTSQLLARTLEDWDSVWTKEGARFAHGTFAHPYCSHTMMFNWLGFPAVTVPCGFVDGLPIGLQIIGKPGSEAHLFRVANAFEKAFPHDQHPPAS